VVREGLQGGARIELLSIFPNKYCKYIHSYDFCLLDSVNKFLTFGAAYFSFWFLEMAITFSHSHFLHVAFVAILVFQTFDRIIFGKLTFLGTRWYVLTLLDCYQKSLGTTALHNTQCQLVV